jgi:hypothetical protein
VQAAVAAPDVQFAVQAEQLGTGHAVRRRCRCSIPRNRRSCCTATCRSRVQRRSSVWSTRHTTAATGF